MTRRELSAAAHEALLSPKEREIVDMIYIHHLSIVSIAIKLGYAESTVRLKHRQAVAKIQNVIKKGGQD